MFALLVAAALAGPATSEEIVVWGDAVDQARDALISDLQDLGYTRIKRRGDVLQLKHADPWKGKVWLHDDGWMATSRQGVRIEAAPLGKHKANSAMAWLSCVGTPTRCIRVGGMVVSSAKFRAQERRTVHALHPNVTEWGDRIADRRVDATLDDLPDRMQALWDTGAPLRGTEPVEGYRARRAALLEFWDTRTENAWGQRVRRAVEGFLIGEVQHSEHPLEAGELATFNEERRSLEPLDLRGDRTLHAER